MVSWPATAVSHSRRPGAGLDGDRAARQEDPPDRHPGQVREQDRKDIKIAQRA